MPAVTRSKLEALFHLPLQEAATHVGIGRTLFKRVCRREGIRQWPQLSKSGARQAKQVERERKKAAKLVAARV